MDACGEQWKEIMETQLARKVQAGREAQEQCETDGRKKKGRGKKDYIVERTLACTKAAVTKSISISIDGGTMTSVEVMEQLKPQSAVYASVQGPTECGSRAAGKGTFTASGKQALNWEVRALEFSKYPLNGILQRQDLLVVSEKRKVSSADFPDASIEESWIKELGKMFEVRLEQLRCNLTDEHMLRLMKPSSLDAQLWPGRSAAVMTTQTELTELSNDVKTHLVMVVERLSSNPDFLKCFASANTCSALFGSYFANNKYLDQLRDIGRLLSPWENGLANNIGFCHETGAVTARNGRLSEDISLTDLVAEPSQRDTFEMERRCLLYISDTLCDGVGGVGRAATLQPLGSMQHYQDGEFPVAKTKVSSVTSPDSGIASFQCRKNTYIRFQAGYATPLAR
jgi:hypothetical protein